jgi:hypothetical protein
MNADPSHAEGRRVETRSCTLTNRPAGGSSVGRTTRSWSWPYAGFDGPEVLHDD